ncbi:GUN4 N-terminal ARM-like repeat domain-containing protein [Romeria aff. gracilis LEGE 07310]|uniref:GUN4 N-terminal ARM-like repeat domain-containing protein n=1 Tax=Vasconcelosia minhoensis LEGE 07310 TaxID=915328 RepID=A0A8J7A4G4_9CYAN|nr:GUN4 domain-containing protein [Romeria gracilis]MBE9076052.1 GUN4 N-terminal ARM-like repeat domain-containing protein [Romeria aff. gracilis LEGE 07310]
MSNFSADTFSIEGEDAAALELRALADQLSTESLKKQLAAALALAEAGEVGVPLLIQRLRSRQPQQPQPVEGKIYQLLAQHSSQVAQSFLATELPQGIVTPQSDRGISYDELQQRLVQKDYQTADRLTLQKLCELAGADAIQRKWVYFTEVDGFPMSDLQTLDRLWRVYSEDRFGFSQQRAIWLRVGQDWERLWQQLAWRTDGAWTRYPNEFIWDLSAPVGHLPLSNQLRGVRMMASLLAHPAWVGDGEVR